MNRLAKLLAGFAMGIVVVSSAFADDFILSLPQGADDPVTLVLPDGFVAEPANFLQVFVGSADGCCDDRIPVAGRYALENNLLSFTPAFGFDLGGTYVARVRGLQIDELTHFSIAPDNETVLAAVNRIYPSGDVLPENTLRFYIHFSVPMMPGVAFDFIKLRDASGAADAGAFMRFKQELWNEDRTRLTVLIDPGRIKREVATNVELGPALRAGQEYALTVEGGWPSSDGTSTVSGFTKKFRVTDALRTRPDTRRWIANSPCAGSREPLSITLDRSFDRHLLTRALRVETGRSERIDGEIEITGAEDEWTFVPLAPWPAGDLLLLANATLEAVAGNNFRDLLDHVASQQETDLAESKFPIRIRNCAD